MLLVEIEFKKIYFESDVCMVMQMVVISFALFKMIYNHDIEIILAQLLSALSISMRSVPAKV